MITFCASRNSATQGELFKGAAEGLKKYGIEALHIRHDRPRTDLVACWGWRRGQVLHKRGHDVLVFERAYLGDRFFWTSLAWNGLNGRGDFKLPSKMTGKRFKDNYTLKPWRDGGSIITIMGQVPGDMSLMGKDLTALYEDLAIKLKLYYGRDVYYRPHPHGKTNFRPRIPVLDGDLEEALSEAFLVVTYNSNSAVDAVVNGIPALSLDIGSMAYEVTGHDIQERIFPDRTKWAHKLAHCQWSPDEIKNGDWVKRMCHVG